mmetsp:Transcript_19924/g.59060  ORF Transcript_19924/g.59060 Transcript_19924/m.59060 type:complete len:277 (+) Transcript_19924:71-901(+)
MPSVKDLGKRLKSVTSTSKITKAMKMVAASKLKKAETDMAKARPFAASVQSLMMPHIGVKEEDETPSTVLALAISSDKGLCGGVNSKMAKEVKLGMEAYVGKGVESPEVLMLGSKGRDAMARTHSKFFKTTYDEAYGGKVTFSLASFLAEQMLASSADSYVIYYNKFKSVINFDVTALAFKGPEVLGGSGVMDEYEFEGEKEEILADLYQFNLAVSIYSCILENVTSEQASRMTAMDSASTNASEMIEKLQVQYNRLRQAKITTELTEIVAGAESV